LNNKIVSTKSISSIFLGIVLVAGTITAIFPFIKTAQAQPYYEFNNYGPPEYPDNRYQKSYGKDDNRDKSKDIKSIDINKIKCINTNININGNNAGNISLGNKGAAEGYSGAYSSGSNGYSDKGYSKQDKGFECIINNNNTNLVGGSNQTEPLLTCEECFTENLNEEQLNNLTDVLSRSLVVNLEGLCEQLSNATLTNQQKLFGLSAIFINAGITIETDADTILRVLECLEELGLIIVPPDFGLPNSMR
jgi:hypothetical protein